MKGSSRSVSRQNPTREIEPYLKFLKPGALAQLRELRISARWHQHRIINSFPPLISPPTTPNVAGQEPQVNVTDGFPCFSSRIYGPICPQRKKLVAAKTVLFLSSSLSSPIPVSDLPDPIINVLNNDTVVVAH